MNVPPALAAAGDVAAAEVEAEAVTRGPIVTSGESDEGVLDDDEEDPRTSQDDDDVDSDDALVSGDHHGAGHASSSQQQEPQQPHDEYLYDDQADERDEAYVNQHLRSAGIIIRQQQQQQQQQQRRDKDKNLKYNKTSADADNESNQNNHNSSNRDEDNQKKQQQQKQPKKAKNSDAVLSCPCCFTTVCMDCQRHERFQNQYRAMFVMNILVQWDNLLAYNNVTKRLEPASATTTTATATATATARTTTTMTNSSITTLQSGKQHKSHAAAAAAADTDTDDDIIYHAVCCANCQTQVAALDMTEEVYHFFGCIASS
jgi:E2F-associated phosphoprotein